MARADMDTPIIFGVLCKDAPQVSPTLKRRLAASVKGAVLLPFQVQPRHLKNVVECMRLMDVAGLVIDQAHARAMVRHVPRLHASAKESGRVDIIIRRGRSFQGFCARRMAQAEAAACCRKGGKCAKDVDAMTFRISVELLTDSDPSN